VERSELEDDEPPTRTALAAHEAGHAVAAWALGRRVERVWIDSGGGTEVRNTKALPLIDQVAIGRAGAYATELLGIPAPPWMARKDREKVLFEILTGLPHDEGVYHVQQGGDRAYDLLEANKTMLTRLADVLEQAGTLDHAEIMKIANEYGEKVFTTA
jgi:peptidase M50B-like protein